MPDLPIDLEAARYAARRAHDWSNDPRAEKAAEYALALADEVERLRSANAALVREAELREASGRAWDRVTPEETDDVLDRSDDGPTPEEPPK